MKYQRPGYFNARIANGLLMLLIRLGVSPAGAQMLAVRGRRSGETRTVPVNPVPVDGTQYLLAPRGNTEWVRNLRAAGEGELRVGGKRARFRAEEIGDAEKPPVIRAYLKRWIGQVRAFFPGVDGDSPDDALLSIAPEHPAFRLTPMA
jgi:deazaflavin-dependent oxidoreductase (nitroreductase family)